MLTEIVIISIYEINLLFRIHGLTYVKLVSFFQPRDSVFALGALYKLILDPSYVSSK